jgi:glucan endo-1,3-alpha-glucosidase
VSQLERMHFLCRLVSEMSRELALKHISAKSVSWLRNADCLYFRYRTILSTFNCASDTLGKPAGSENAEDVVNVAVLLSKAGVGATISVSSGDSVIGSFVGVEGLNAWSVAGLSVGAVSVKVESGGATVLSANGQQNVVADAALCNYNYQVAALA